MRLAMSYQARRELLIRIIPRYREADRNRKRAILDEFVVHLQGIQENTLFDDCFA